MTGMERNGKSICKDTGSILARLTEVFNNPMLTKIDTQHYDEERWIGLGLTHKFVVLVVYTDQGEEKIRIISIRKATKREGYV